MSINLRNPAAQKLIIAGTLLFGLLYGYVNFVYTPREEKIKKLGVDIKRETDLLTKGKRIAANFQSVQEDYQRLMESWETAHELLPSERETEELLKNITVEGQNHNVSFLLFRPRQPVENPYYWEYPIEVKTLSAYHDLGEFLSAVAGMRRIVNVNDLKLSIFTPNKGRSPYTVEAEFIASIYVFKELGAPATATPDADGKTTAPERPATTPLKSRPPKPQTKPKTGGTGV